MTREGCIVIGKLLRDAREQVLLGQNRASLKRAVFELRTIGSDSEVPTKVSKNLHSVITNISYIACDQTNAPRVRRSAMKMLSADIREMRELFGNLPNYRWDYVKLMSAHHLLVQGIPSKLGHNKICAIKVAVALYKLRQICSNSEVEQITKPVMRVADQLDKMLKHSGNVHLINTYSKEVKIIFRSLTDAESICRIALGDAKMNSLTEFLPPNV